MYRVWEDIKTVVEEKDKEEYDEGEDAELDGSADLNIYEYWHRMSDHWTYNPACHL